jgi:hypothetical protein
MITRAFATRTMHRFMFHGRDGSDIMEDLHM